MEKACIKNDLTNYQKELEKVSQKLQHAERDFQSRVTNFSEEVRQELATVHQDNVETLQKTFRDEMRTFDSKLDTFQSRLTDAIIPAQLTDAHAKLLTKCTTDFHLDQLPALFSNVSTLQSQYSTLEQAFQSETTSVTQQLQHLEQQLQEVTTSQKSDMDQQKLAQSKHLQKKIQEVVCSVDKRLLTMNRLYRDDLLRVSDLTSQCTSRLDAVEFHICGVDEFVWRFSKNQWTEINNLINRRGTTSSANTANTIMLSNNSSEGTRIVRKELDQQQSFSTVSCANGIEEGNNTSSLPENTYFSTTPHIKSNHFTLLHQFRDLQLIFFPMGNLSALPGYSSIILLRPITKASSRTASSLNKSTTVGSSSVSTSVYQMMVTTTTNPSSTTVEERSDNKTALEERANNNPFDDAAARRTHTNSSNTIGGGSEKSTTNTKIELLAPKHINNCSNPFCKSKNANDELANCNNNEFKNPPTTSDDDSTYYTTTTKLLDGGITNNKTSASAVISKAKTDAVQFEIQFWDSTTSKICTTSTKADAKGGNKDEVLITSVVRMFEDYDDDYEGIVLPNFILYSSQLSKNCQIRVRGIIT